MEGVERRMLMPSEALTERRAGMEAEKTKAGPLMRCVWRGSVGWDRIRVGRGGYLVVDDCFGAGAEAA